YYNQDRVTSFDDYRSGAGEAILLPLANGTLDIHNVTGSVRSWVPLSLNGQPATVVGPIGFTRSTFPLWLYVPVRSTDATGVGIFDLITLRMLATFSLPN